MSADARPIDMANLNDLAPIAKQLNAESDQLTAALQTIQAKLNALGVGIAIRLDESLTESDWRDILDRDNEPTGHRECDVTYLGYGRHGEEWKLLVHTLRLVEGPDGNNMLEQTFYEDVSPTPLLGASREIRALAVEHLEALIERLQLRAQQVVDRIQKAKKIADSLT